MHCSVNITFTTILQIIVLFYTVQTINAQLLESKIKGIVIDADTRISLPGATVILDDFKSKTGTVSNSEGKFYIENVLVGRHNLKISFVGYSDVNLKGIEVISGRELFLTVEMHQTVIIANEVVVTAKSSKSDAINEMAAISTRTFTVEETSKYAGNWGDPSRMASKYAGVTISSDERNDIIVRGNSPIGMLWR